MASRLDPITEELLKRVTWEWQPVEPLVQELIPMVAPGKALRAYDANHESYSRIAQPDPSLKRVLTEDEKQASGARTIVNSRIHSMRDSGRVETEGARENRRIRFKERRVADRPAPDPIPQQDRGGSMFGGKGEQALRVAESLTRAWADHKADIERWKSEVLEDVVGVKAELNDVRSKQRDHARTVQGQVESINDKLGAIDITGNEVLEREVNELRDQVNILRETVRDTAEDGNMTSQALGRLVNRLSGAVSTKEVLGANWTSH